MNKKQILSSIAALSLSLAITACGNVGGEFTSITGKSTSNTNATGSSTSTSASTTAITVIPNVPAGKFEYLLNPDGASYTAVLAKDNAEVNVIFPSAHNGLPVTSVKSEALNRHSIKSITIPEGVESMGDNISLGGFTQLTHLFLPSTLKEFDKESFSDCRSIESIVIGEGGEYFYSYQNTVIDIKKKAVILGCKNSVLPSDGSVARIEDRAFYLCEGLTEINIPYSVTYIGKNAFAFCKSLTQIDISSVTDLGVGAFQGCTSLKKVVLSEKITDIRNNTFYQCTSLEEINIPTHIPVADSAFNGCINMPGYYQRFDYSLDTTLDGYILRGIGECRDASLNIPAIYKGKPVLGVAKEALQRLSETTNIYISDGITFIERRAFKNCLPQYVRLPSTIEFVGEDAFNFGEKAEYNSYGGGLYIGNEENPYLVLAKTEKNTENFLLHPDTRVIASCAFKDDHAVKTVVLHEGIVGIGANAFQNTTIKEIILPSTIVNIGDEAFASMTDLEKVTFKCPIPSTYNIFRECTSLKTVVIEEGTKAISVQFLMGATALEHLYLPSTLEYIDAYILSSESAEGAEVVFHYNGTVSEWENMRKDKFWNNSPQKITIVCSDGTIEII